MIYILSWLLACIGIGVTFFPPSMPRNKWVILSAFLILTTGLTLAQRNRDEQDERSRSEERQARLQDQWAIASLVNRINLTMDLVKNSQATRPPDLQLRQDSPEIQRIARALAEVTAKRAREIDEPLKKRALQLASDLQYLEIMTDRLRQGIRPVLGHGPRARDTLYFLLENEVADQFNTRYLERVKLILKEIESRGIDVHEFPVGEVQSATEVLSVGVRLGALAETL